MKFNILFFIIFLINLLSLSLSNTSNFKLGIYNLDDYKSYFGDNRIGLITNPTGIKQFYESSIDYLFRTVNLKALYAPEHGISGDQKDGSIINTTIDVITNLTIYSLYGKTLQPTEEMLKDIDILYIDILDVGAKAMNASKIVYLIGQIQ